jgi:pimeloyl-ACP methyl ester carboxylesterase
MMRLNQILTKLSRRRSLLVRAMVTAQVVVARHWPSRAIELMIKQMPEADAAIVRRPEVRALFELDAARSSRTTAMAAVQDLELLARDWGFELGHITIPVHLWQGDADLNVPPNHARLQQEAIPGSVLHEVSGEGHLMGMDHIGEILETLKGA